MPIFFVLAPNWLQKFSGSQFFKLKFLLRNHSRRTNFLEDRVRSPHRETFYRFRSYRKDPELPSSLLGRAVMLSRKKVNVGYGQSCQGKIDAPKGVSILLKTDAKTLSTVHWEIVPVTYLRGTSPALREV